MDIKTGILNLSGPVVTLRALKQSARILRTVTEDEFKKAAENLSVFGKLVTVRLPRQPKDSVIFLKKSSKEVVWPETDVFISRESFSSRFALPIHSAIGANLKNALVDGKHVAADCFP